MNKYWRKIASWRRSIIMLVIAVLLLFAGLYILLLVVAPKFTAPAVTKIWNVPVEDEQISENRLYIPRLKLNLTYKDGDESVLFDNLWHRSPERGNPELGGNFILAGHRLELGITPQETNRRSPLYHIDKLQIGDKIYADFNGKRYEYEISELLTVKPTQTEIESPSVEPKLTLYTCTLEGESDGREVVIAKQTRRAIDPEVIF